MANHKKKRPLNRRGHCKMCKYWKINGINRDDPIFESFSNHKRRMWAKIEAKETKLDDIKKEENSNE